MDDLSERRKEKIFFIVVFSLTALVVVMAVFSYRAYLYVTYRGYRFRLDYIDSDRVVLVDPNGSELIAERSIGSFTIYVFDEVIRHDFRPSENARVFTFPNGEEVVTEWTGINRRRLATSPQETDEWRLYQSLRHRYLVHGDMRLLFIGAPLAGFLFLMIGAWNAIYPRKAWQFRHMFSVAHGEPTEFALAMHILSGYVIMIVGFIAAVGLFSTAWR